jgi:uncharacterized protein YegP (UPF0339 family)
MTKPAKFIIYRDFDGWYRWRLRSVVGGTIAVSKTGHHRKASCDQDLEYWRLKYPDVLVRDATIRGFEKQRPQGLAPKRP